jgi:hypothetical protein
MSTAICTEFAAHPYVFLTRWDKSIQAHARESCPELDTFPGDRHLLGRFGLEEVSSAEEFAAAVSGRTTHTARLSLRRPVLNLPSSTTDAVLKAAVVAHEERRQVVDDANKAYLALKAAVLASVPPHVRASYAANPDALRTVAAIRADMHAMYGNMPAHILTDLRAQIQAPFDPSVEFAIALAQFQDLIDSLPAAERACYPPHRICELVVAKLCNEHSVHAYMRNRLLHDNPITTDQIWDETTRQLFLTLVPAQRAFAATAPPTGTPINAFAAALAPAPAPVAGTAAPRPRNIWCPYHGLGTHNAAACRCLERDYPQATHPRLWASTRAGTYDGVSSPIQAPRPRFTRPQRRAIARAHAAASSDAAPAASDDGFY